MADSIGQAYVQILPTTKGFSSKLSSELGGGGAGGALTGAGKSMGGKLIAGLAAAGIGAAVVKGISSSIEKGGELQQSLGGIEALFGKSADTVKQNASKAFQTVGVSANDYMENVTSFSAALINGLNGDTGKAASIADMAMQDMGDNANRFGTDIQSIQNAYQGFAKGNFTMLDNLKLGYGGTKTEMLRLVKETGVVDQSVKSIDEVSFDQMIEGIHKAQEGLNVTGTTAKEASTTLQGSMASMKAAAEDLMGNLAIGADITPQISALLQTAQTFLIENLIPMISNVVTGVANNAGQLAGVLSTLIMSVGQEIIKVAPQLLQAGITLVVQLGQSLVKGVPKLIPMVAKLITDLALMLTEPKNLESLIMTGLQLIIALAEGLGKAAPKLISVIPKLVMNLVNTFIKLAPKLIPVALKLISTLVKGLLGQVGALLKAGRTLFTKLKETFTGLMSKFTSVGSDIIKGIGQGIENMKQWLIKKLEKLASYLPEPVKKLLGIGSPSKVFADEVGKWIPAGVALGITQNAGVVDKAMNGMFRNPMLTSSGMSMNITARDNTSSYSGLLEAVRQGASEARPVVILNNRVLSRELKGMGVSFA